MSTSWSLTAFAQPCHCSAPRSRIRAYKSLPCWTIRCDVQNSRIHCLLKMAPHFQSFFSLPGLHRPPAVYHIFLLQNVWAAPLDLALSNFYPTGQNWYGSINRIHHCDTRSPRRSSSRCIGLVGCHQEQATQRHPIVYRTSATGTEESFNIRGCCCQPTTRERCGGECLWLDFAEDPKKRETWHYL